MVFIFKESTITLSVFKSLLFLSFTNFLAVYATYKYCTRKKEQDTVKEIHEAMLFMSNVTESKKSKYSRCMITKSMDRLLYYLSQTRYNLDICMYVLTNADLTNALIKLHYRGVKIRMIIDADMAFAQGSGIKRLEKQGIPIRWMKSTNLMHHKYCLVDTLSDNKEHTPLVMMGSLNWTNQAVWGNFEDYSVTSQKVLVRSFSEHFEQLWIMFKPIV